MTNAYASSILRKTLGHASRSKKPQNQTQRADFPKKGNLQKPKPFSFMLILLALLCGRTVAWAQTEWDGSATNDTYTISSNKTIGDLTIPMGNTLTLNITGDNITFQFGTIELENGDDDNTTPGANLNLNVTGKNVKLKFNRIKTNNANSKTKAGTVTLNNSGSNFIVNKRDKSNSTNNLFYIAKNWSLEVIGTEANPVTFDGEWTMAENGIPTDNDQIANWKAYGVYYSSSGDITFRNVKVKNFVSNAVASKGEGGVFRYSGSPDMIMTTELTNVEIYQCYAGLADINFTPSNVNNSYGRIIGIYNGILVANCNNLKIHHCFVHEPDECEPKISGMGGVIRSQGSVGGTFTIENSSFHHNTYMNRKTQTPKLTGQGGVINWRSGVDACGHEGKLVIKNCEFYNNKAKHGGAISTNGKMHLEGVGEGVVAIHDNEAVCGGGVFFWTYNGKQPAYNGEGFNAVIGKGVEIYNNTATEYGGGAYLTIDASNDVGFNANQQPMSPSFQVQINAGCKIYHNKAPKGAGIAIKDGCPYSHKNIAGDGHPSIWSGEYQRTVTIDGGEVYDNYADGTTGDEMAGAGIYIEKYEYDEYDDPNHPLYGFHSDYIGDGNTNPDAQNNSGTLTVNLESGKIYDNTAVNDEIPGKGGGVYIASKFETNTIKSTLNVNIGKTGKNLEVYGNQAYTDGGGVYVLYDRTDSRQNQGTVTVAGGTIGKTNLATGNKALNGNGGGICVMSGTVVVENGHVDYNTANQKGGGIYLDDGNLTFTGGNVDQNEASNSDGGGICVMGGTVEVAGGHVDHNTANQNGGGIYLDGGNLTFTGGNVDQNEASNGNGGGICVMSGTVSVENGHVDHNTANQKGGGIYLDDGNLTFTGGSVDQNKASNSDGGGICVESGNIVVSGGTVSNNKAILKNGGGICVLGGTVLVEGGNILTNTANELGGGVYVSVQDATIITKIQGGANISSNSAKGGGGVYVDKGKLDVVGNVWNTTTLGWEPLDWPDPYDPASEATHTRITNNTATDGNGGGINAGDGTVEITNTLIYNNTASGTVSKGRGGGVYLDGGIIKIVSSKILYNTAETNGGGIDDHSGDIEIYGGDISHNTATNGRGGGIYTNAGDIRIWPSALYNPDQTPTLDQCKNTGTVFSYNTAGTNGGGLNTHIGRLDVRYANVHHNEAGHNYQSIGTSGGSGGGMFCEGPHADLSGYTVRLLHTYLDYNKAFGNSDEESNLTGRGGGLYLKYGSIFAEHCYVRNNEADINGGGLDNHDGELRVYGSFVENNQAKNGKGGGLYTDKGNLVVGPCDSYGFVESKASRICNNTAHINGGGINNHEGDITIHGDRINNNTAETGDGGGVYINSGQIYMYGGQINNNKADNGKGGGVYGGGGTFNIMEREAHPILEILDVENITTNSFTVHFHHVDRGNAMKEDAEDKEYGIAFSVNPYPSDLGENVDWTGHWQDVTEVKVGPTNGTPIPTAPHTYNQYEGCSRFVVNNSTTPNGITINSNTTYYVVAYGKYTYGGKNYFDASPAVAVKTYGNNPVVVTGVAFDITTNSASVNGKLFYEGVGTLLEKGIEISSDYGANWVKHPAQSVGNVFSITFSGLESSKIYKARAYAKCQSGDNQYESQDAEIITFFTLGNSPVVATGEASVTANSATVSGELLYEGVGTLHAKGIEISSDYGANWEKHQAQSVGNVFSVAFSVAFSDSDLESSKIYKARAYATCQSEEGYQYESQDAEIITFFTLGNSPVVATGKASEIGENSATVSGELLYVGDGSSTVTKGIRYSKDGEDSWTNVPFSGSEAVFSVTLTEPELESGTTYKAQAYATNNLEHTGYGEIIKFTTTTGTGGKAPQGPRSVYPVVEENPFFMELTPLQQAMLANALEGDTTAAPASGATTERSRDNDTPVNIPQINENTARYGGGICIDKQGAKLVFSGTKGEVSAEGEGQINKNFASEAGGGIYISQNASMQMKHHCQVVENHVPAGKDGGGIYLDGTLLVGDKKEDDATYHSLKVDLNWAGDGEYTEAERNNVFLPLDPILDGDALHKKRVITLLSDISGKINDIFVTKIGISVDRGFREVIYSENDEHEGGAESTKQWLEKLMPESGNVLNSSLFDDKQTYYALHVTPTDNLFDEDYIYFWSCWTTIVNSDPNNDGTGTTHYTTNGESGANEVWHINTREGLAWFSSLINGLNGVTANPAAKAFVENDLDMSAHLWVPLGSVNKAEGTGTDIIFTPGGQYSGEFDGQGNIISGLICTYMTGIFKYGLFGTLAEGAKVKNTFVDNYMFTTYKQKNPEVPGSYIINPAYKMGGIAAEMNNGTAVISNCEARGQMKAVVCDAENTYVGGIAGDVQQGAIHSCMAMPTITGTAQYMGGLAGNLAAATTLKNSYANVLFSTTPTPTYPVGGIAGVNNGTIENVYVRYRNDNQVSPLTLPDEFYWFVGNNPNQTGGQNSINFCYAPDEQRGKHLSAPKPANNRRGYLPTNLVDNKYGFAHKDQQMVKKSNWNEETDVNDYADNANGAMVVDSLSGLLRTLNKWVKAANKTSTIYTPWTRTMASTINDDYPVLEIADFNVVGTEDGVYMKYDYDVNDMWAENGKNFKALTAADNPKAAMYLYKTNGVTAKNSTPVAINVTGNTAVPLHIHENIGITQETGKEELTARVGVTFDNSNGKAYLNLGGEPYDWHMFSSALKAAPLGITYQSSQTNEALGGKTYEIFNNITGLSNTGITHTNYGKRDYMDPPVIIWNTEKGTVGYFPTNTPYGKWGGDGHWPRSGAFSNTEENPYSFDFYCFHEESRHWINFKREGTDGFMDHWHEDIDGSDNHKNLWYKNESTLQVGKGYMMGVSAVSMLMADGILNNGTFTSEEQLSNSPYNFNMSGYSEELRGTNLVGNPYQSYLNFNDLVSANPGTIHSNTYYLFDADKQRYLSYTTSQGDNPQYAPRVIHPHQGFFIKTANNGARLNFNNDMRAATGNEYSYFRGQNLNYPLVNLFCYDVDGFYDLTTVEMNRPELGGGEKLKDMRFGNSLLYASVAGTDYQVLFAPEGTSTVAVRFKASQNGVYTMRWETMHGDFHYLHLIDNMSGADVDMLRSEEYRFEASTSDYISRFKLVFEVTGLEEEDDNEDDNGSSIVNFAFRMGDELIVNGAGYLEVFDVQGRRLSAKRLVDAQSSVSLPNVAAGIYFLRLSDDKQVRTQKMVINY